MDLNLEASKAFELAEVAAAGVVLVDFFWLKPGNAKHSKTSSHISCEIFFIQIWVFPCLKLLDKYEYSFAFAMGLNYGEF